MTVEEYIEKFKFTDQSGIEFISVKNARIALEIALKEEREKAANAFCYVNCHKLKGGDCSMVDECGGFKNFKELINKEQ